MKPALAWIALFAVCAAPAAGRQGSSRDTVIIPGERYHAGPLHRFLLGDHYRGAWTTPVRVPILDLGAFAGGLTPVRRGGGQQTQGLRFLGADGKQYQFRSVDKNPAAILPADLRETLVADIVQDQISSGHPAGALVVGPILDAVGVLHAEPRLLLMPDDPRLGEFRADFAGVLGLIEERPAEGSDTIPGFMGSTRIVHTDRLFERMEEELEQVDAPAFLAARLVDAYLGDWDRHRDQWLWLRLREERSAPWQPIPRDRDQAFVKLDGFLLIIARQSYPQLVKFGATYPKPLGLTWNGRELDRRLLVGLEWPVWDSVATALRAKITDAVIDRAVAQLPPELQRTDGESLRRGLIARRDRLSDFARRFYELLAEDVDVHTTDAPERVEVRRVSHAEMQVQVTARTPAGELPVFRRTFRRGETKEVRLFLQGGADSTQLSGEGDPGIAVRVIGGGGDDVFVDASPGGDDHFYDSAGNNRFVRGAGTHVDERPYTYPGPPFSPSQPPRDWGVLYRFPLWMLLAPDVGLLAGVGIDRTVFGFRQYPSDSRVRLRAAIGTSARTFRAELDARINRENSPVHWTLGARASGLDVLRFHGFGNETSITESDDYYRVNQVQFSLQSMLVVPLGGRSTVAGGPVVRYTRTDLDDDRLIGVTTPYGAGHFGQAGARAELLLDGRDRARAASRGAALNLAGSLFPSIWDVRATYGEMHGDAMTYLTPPIPLRPTLALRAGGRKVWGDYPFSDAATLGDDATVRLGRKQRYAGDAEVHLNAELRVKLFRAVLVLPADIGVFGLRETGRVFLAGESSDTWHNAVGGGVFLAFLQPQNTLSLAIARSAERTGVYVGGGFAW